MDRRFHGQIQRPGDNLLSKKSLPPASAGKEKLTGPIGFAGKS